LPFFLGVLWAGALLGCTSAFAQTQTLTISDLALVRGFTGPNPIGAPPGDVIELSADVTPNGDAGTTGVGQTTNLKTGKLTSMSIPYLALTSDPNLFLLTISPYNANLTGKWTVTFTNNTTNPSVITATTGSIQGVANAPTPTSVTVSGSSLNPTFSWSFPPSITGIQINLYDPAVLIDGHVDNVFSKDIPPAPPSFTLPTVLDGGYTLTPGTTYVLGLKGRVLIDPSGPNIQANSKAQCQTYYTFTPTSTGSVPQVYLPTISSKGVYSFDIAVQPNTTYNIDPPVATGFKYKIGVGDPLIATVVLPVLQGSKAYKVTWGEGP